MWNPYFSLWFFGDIFSDAYYHGSSACLLFIKTMYFPERMLPNFWTDLIVCNPLTRRTKIFLAPESSRSMPSQGILAAEFDGNGCSLQGFMGRTGRWQAPHFSGRTASQQTAGLPGNKHEKTFCLESKGRSMASTSLWKSSRPNNEFDSPTRTEPSIDFYLQGNQPIRYL